MRISLRPAAPTDHNFIFATYIRNQWFAKDQATTLKRATWSQLQHRRLETILANELVLIACLDEDPDLIIGYGFIDSGKPYTYVKLDFRAPSFKIKEKLEKELT